MAGKAISNFEEGSDWARLDFYTNDLLIIDTVIYRFVYM